VSDGPTEAELRARVATLEAKLEASEKRLTAGLALIADTVEELNRKDDAIRAAFDELLGGVTKGLTALSKRLAELERRAPGSRPS
jgi:hypothetical protein